MTPAEAQIVVQTRLQQLVIAAVARAWDNLPGYNEADVAVFLRIVVPLILAAQRQSAAITNAYLARELGRPPAALDITRVIGAAIRSSTPEVVAAVREHTPQLEAAVTTPVAPAAPAGVPPEVVYRRPFVTTWTALARDKPMPEAIAAGRAHATASAAMDVQNTMRHTLVAVAELDGTILGFRRVPNADACELCKLAAGRRYRKSELIGIHEHCRCTVKVITAANRDDFVGKPENDLALNPGAVLVNADGTVAAATRLHGELGPVLVNANHRFTGPDELAA